MSQVNRLWNTSIVELAVSEGSVRLKNSLLSAEEQGSLPANSIYEFVRLGDNPEKRFLRIPNFGAKSAQELVDIVRQYRHLQHLLDLPNDADIEASSPTSDSSNPEQLDLNISATVTLSEIVEKFSDNNRLRNVFVANARLEPIYGLTLQEWETFSERRRKNMLFPLSGFGVLTYRALISAIQSFKQANRDFPQYESTELLNEPSLVETLPQSRFHEPVFEHAIGLLDERSSKVLHMRYESGFTLEEVGKSFGLTRERIRQIEKKGLERFSRKYLSIVDPAELPWLFDKIWERIAGKHCFLRKSTFHEKSLDLPLSHRLSAIAVYGSIRKMVSHFCVERKEVWVFGYDEDAISMTFKTVSEFLKQSPIPLILPWLSSEVNVDLSLVEAAIENDKRYVVHRNIVLESPLTLRKRRLVSLWHLLAQEYSSGPARLMDFHEAYLSENESDQCSARDLLIVMKDQPQLFQRAGSFGWLLLNPAIPLRDPSCLQPIEQSDEVEEVSEQEVSFEYQDPSLRGLLVEILKDGPRPYKEIFESVRKRSGAGYSKGSVAALISSYPEFEFFAPGLIGLFRFRNDARHIEVGKSYLFQPNPVYFGSNCRAPYR
jgi:RNA polymerase sigma factor (sigma-70 family)